MPPGQFFYSGGFSTRAAFLPGRLASQAVRPCGVTFHPASGRTVQPARRGRGCSSRRRPYRYASPFVEKSERFQKGLYHAGLRCGALGKKIEKIGTSGEVSAAFRLDNGQNYDRIEQPKARTEAKSGTRPQARGESGSPRHRRPDAPLHQQPGTTGTAHPRYRMT